MEYSVLITASVYRHIQNFHLPYIKAFQNSGWRVHVACGEAPERIPGAERSITLPFVKRMSAPQNFRASQILRGLIHRERYTMVISHTSLAAFFTRLAVKGLRERPQMVHMSHGYLFDGSTPAGKRALLTGAERFCAPETDLLLAMNRWDLETAQRLRLGRRVEMVPGIGVDFSRLDRVAPELGLQLRQQLAIPKGNFVLIYGAEFSKRKNHETLLRALALLPGWVSLLLPGDGVLLENCRRLADELGVSRRTYFPGQVQDMAPWYAAAGAAVSSSLSEGLPFNIMEAMYLGLPVAASAVKGHTDLLRNGESGLLFPPKDPASCAEQIMELLRRPDLGTSMAAAARADVEPYALERVLPQVMERYLETAGVPVRTAVLF